jgi:hypothetical protein
VTRIADPALGIDDTGRERTLVDARGPCATRTLRGIELGLTGPLAVEDIRITGATSIP